MGFFVISAYIAEARVFFRFDLRSLFYRVQYHKLEGAAVNLHRIVLLKSSHQLLFSSGLFQACIKSIHQIFTDHAELVNHKKLNFFELF
jgi:hypothetical protein